MKLLNQPTIRLMALLTLCLYPFQSLVAQDDILDDMLDGNNEVTNVFNYGMLINNQTTETTKKGTFQLRIQHRFGEMNLKYFGDTVVEEFLGFDGSANIRFGFTFAVSDRFQIGLGRTKIDKVYDFEAKYRFLNQKETSSPFSMALYFNTAVSSQEFPEVAPNEFFADGETPFEYKFAHRLTYHWQWIVSRKFGENWSLFLSPSLIFKTLAPENNKNLLWGATLGGRIKTGITSSIIFEYTAKFNDRSDAWKNPIALGYEIGTAGHAFQMFIATSNQIIPQNLYYSTPLDYPEGEILIGFNIKRTFRNLRHEE